jgi:glucokinase
MTSDNSGRLTLGVDVGGTKIDTALVDSNGNIVATHYRFVDSSKDPDKTIADIIESANICLERSGARAEAMGLGVAGQIDKVNGVVRFSPNLPAWRDVPLKAELEHVLRIPVYVNNDVRVITWGELRHGAGKDIDDLVCLFVGTGIGGGIVTSGCLLEGFQNTAGELGHITVVAGGRKCTCPNDGCLEAYAGGWAIAERARDAVRANPQAGQALLTLAGDIASISSISVSQAYHNGDPLAQRLVKDTAKYLAAGVVTIVNAFNPRLIIMGGGVIEGLPELVEMVEKRVLLQALPTPVEHLQITKAALGSKAGVIGAAAWAGEQILKTKGGHHEPD